MPELTKVQIGAEKYASVVLHPQNQNIDSVRHIVESMLKLAGCAACGRLAKLRIDFITDPPADLIKNGVISMTHEGLK